MKFVTAMAASAVISLSASFAVQAATMVETFDTAPSGWTADRYAPAGFNAPVSFDGDNRLAITVDASDGATSRPPAFSSSFYNTQGMQLTNPANTIFTSIDFYLSAASVASTDRIFGLWGVGYDITDTLSSYPIIEFANGEFRYWDGSWTSVGLLGVSAETWVTLAFLLDTANDVFQYFVNGALVGSVAADGTAYVGATILQGYNTEAGVTRTVYADNLVLSDTAPIPLPATAPLMASALIGLAGMLGWRRQRQRAA